MTRRPAELGRMLRDARESKGVSLERAERETRIRARYLSALEYGEYRDLPGPVYTRGFLRSYGTYLGLDPDRLLELYRREAPPVRTREPRRLRPLAIRGPRVLISSTAVAAVLVTLLVGGIATYLGLEVAIFARTPTLRLTDPPGDVRAFQGSRYTLRGITEPNARVTVAGPRTQRSVTAAADGRFEVEMPLLPGANLLTVVAHDPLTRRDSDELRRTITVTVRQ